VARLKHRLEYAGFLAALGLNRLVGDDAAARVGETIGRLGYPLGLRRDVVERNLRVAFPERDAAWIARVARASYAHFGRELLVMLRLSLATREEVIERTVIDGADPAIRDYHDGRGVVVVAGHFGNWELGAAAYTARGYEIDAIAKRASNPLFYQHILDARQRLGLRVIDMRGASRQALRSLSAGRGLALVADQYTGRMSVPVPFFGRPTPMLRAPAVLALRSGAPMYICLPARLPDGRYHARLERIDTSTTDDAEGDVARITADWAAHLEAAVREYPEQYLWHHRRWRDRPAGPVHASVRPSESPAPAEEPEPPAAV
jgi:KDO2-lipid IV(A) lauroyltransferase